MPKRKDGEPNKPYSYTGHSPRITYSQFTHKWSIVTRYKEAEGIDAVTGAASKYYVPLTKWDVTDQMNAILKQFGIGEDEIRFRLEGGGEETRHEQSAASESRVVGRPDPDRSDPST